MTTLQSQAAVKRGVALLDSKVYGWREMVDPSILDMNHWERCVLGQVYGTYCRGVEDLGLVYSNEDEPHTSDTVSYGFLAMDEVEEGAFLGALWKAEL